MSIELRFDEVMESSDGGETVFEVVTTVGRLVDLIDDGYLEVGNARPDHERVTTRRGERFKRVSDRQKRWTEQLSRGKGILGNLSWNVDPDHNDVEWDADARVLRIKGKDGGRPIIKTPDSATRHRSILDAAKAPMVTIDMDRKLSIRVWNVYEAPRPGELSFPQVFDSYNQDGKPVNQTVAKFNYQNGRIEQLAYDLVKYNPNLGLDNVETIQNSVARESRKLCAFNTLSTAFKDGYEVDITTDAEFSEEYRWVSNCWDQLVRAIPDLGLLSLAERKQSRRESVAASATFIHAYVRLMAHIRQNNLPVETVNKIAGIKVTLLEDGLRTTIDPVSGQVVSVNPAGTVVDYFSFDNPLWTSIGVVTAKEKDDGTTAAETRNAYQTRLAAFRALLDAIASN
jgi:hypothetical protein